MDAKPRPWSVKGVSPEARELARAAALQSGMGIGRWIDRIILAQAGPAATAGIDGTALAARVTASEGRIDDLIGAVTRALDSASMRLALLETRRGIAPEADGRIIQLDALRTGGVFEMPGHDGVPELIPAAATIASLGGHPTKPARRRATPRRWAIAASLLLIGASASYIAIDGAMHVPPPAFAALANLTASVGPALRQLGTNDQADNGPARNGRSATLIPVPPSAPLALAPPPATRERDLVARLEARAAADNAAAQYGLARIFAEGRARPKDDTESVRWLTAAAANGHRQAQFELAEAYASGRGVPASPINAAAWYHRAAARDHRRAQYALGMAYAEGAGIDRDYAQAAAWLERAAIGQPAAQYALGVLHERGVVSDASPDAALTWYQAAAANGFPRAAERVAAINLVRANARPAAPVPPSRPVRDHDSLTEIQSLLTELGFDPGPVDGRIGGRTRSAIRRYQQDLGLRIDGRPTDRLRAHMRSVVGLAGTRAAN